MVRRTKKTCDWSKEPQTVAEFINLGQELIEWAQQENSLTINGFPIKKMMSSSIFHALPEKSTQFSQAYEIALSIIGSKRERLAHEGALNAHIVRETMPLYDPMYRKWLVSQKNKDENIGETKIITVNIPTFYDCPDGSHKGECEKLLEQRNLKKQGN